jgi:hypothetical protein
MPLSTILRALALLLVLAGPALAQPAQIVSTCGAQSLPVGTTISGRFMDATGNECTNATGSGGGTSSSFGAAFPATGTAAGFTNGTNLSSAKVFDTDSGAGTENTLGVVLRGSSSGGSVELGTTTNPVNVAGGDSQGVATSGEKGSLVLCATTTAATGGSNATSNAINCTPAGALRSDLSTIAGTAPDVSNGSAGTGTQRTTVANNNTAIGNWGQGATGSAVPSGAQYIGANQGGNLTGLIGCASKATYDASTNGLTQLVAASGSTTIYVCGYVIKVATGGSAVNVALKSGDTGGSCANSAVMTPAYEFGAGEGVAEQSSFYRGLSTPSSKALCLSTNAGVAVQAVVYYTQF